MAGRSTNSAATVTDRRLFAAVVVIIVGVLGTSLAQFQVLGLIPLKNLLKNELHADRAGTAAFLFWIQLAWYFKPLAGIITDAFPIFGSRRKSYMLIGATATIACWLLLYVTPHQYGRMLAVGIAINVFTVLTSTVVGAYLVETAQSFSAAGRLTAVRNFVEQGAFVIAGPLGGVLGAIAFGWTAAACAAVVALIVPTAIFFMHEHTRPVDSHALLQQAGTQLTRVVHAKTMWAAAVFSALFYCAPGIATAVFYRQQDVLHMTTEGQGTLVLLGGVFGVLAATVYGSYACRRFTLRQLLVACIAIGALSQFAYLFYSTVPRARVIESLYGFGWTLADIALMNLAVRATPAGSEGLGFSLMMSVRNISLFGSDWVGSKLIDTHHVSFNGLVVANGLISLIAVPFIFMLPALIVDSTDSSRRAAAVQSSTPLP